MKTLQGWNESTASDFTKYAKPGDEIDYDLYWYFLGVVPPVYMAPGGFLMGEPVTHDRDGDGIYESFIQSGDRYWYTGPLTEKQFEAVLLAKKDRPLTDGVGRYLP